MKKASRRPRPPKPPHNGGSGIPQVTGLIVTSINPITFMLTWNPVIGATSYYIFRNGTAIWIVQNNNYLDEYLPTNTSFTYAVAAVVNSVLGPQSISITVKTTA